MSAEALEARLATRRRQQAEARRREGAAGRLAVAAFLAGLAAAVLRLDAAAGLGAVPALGLWGLVLVFLWRRREQRSRARRRLDHAVTFLEQELRRRADHWDFGQEDGHEYLDPAHPYAADLDLFGPGGLFQRLNACRTAPGRDRLAALLLEEPPYDGLEERQEAVRELAADLDFRERLAVALRNPGQGREPDAVGARWLLEWSEEEMPAARAREGTTALVLGLVATAALAAAFLTDLGWLAVAPSYLLHLFLLQRARDLDAIEEQVHRARQALRTWSGVLALLEDWRPRSPALRAEIAPILAGPEPASKALRRLEGIFHRLTQRRNAAWRWTFGVLWLWDLHGRRALLRWHARHGRALGDWLRAAAAVEARSACAAWAAAVEAETCWPRLAGPGEPLLRARELGHPLLPRERRVGNDLEMGRAGEVLLVTGSNMSGKSTFLRSAGLAVVLARLGLPVCAREMALRPLQVVTSMRVQDDLIRGTSRFQAEVERLRFCLDRARDAPGGLATLVLLDEILAGTNSRDRHAGTVAVLQELRGLRAITLLSTHDLDLAELARDRESGVRLVHFRDRVEDGRMVFDYRLRPGPLPEANALRILRQAGLAIPDSGPALD